MPLSQATDIMGKLTTHVLDTSAGVPGSGIRVRVFRVDGDQREFVTEVMTNSDGRCDQPLLQGDSFVPGVLELEFAAGDYFRKTTDLPSQPFLDNVVLRFGIDNADQHYHVPLLVSPYAYSTYRGS